MIPIMKVAIVWQPLCFILLSMQRAGIAHEAELHTVDQMRAGMNVVIDERNACSSNPKVVILVTTSVNYFDRRTVIRNTWAKLARERYDMRTLFVLARSPDGDVMEKVLQESRDHQDILMGDFIESYYNLTLKTVFALNWMNQTCKADFMVKMDDDVVLNPGNLLSLVHGLKDTGSVYCNLRQWDWPVRERDHKNYVSYHVFPDEYWPDYCSGAGVVMSSETAGTLVEGALRNDTNPKIWVDDCFMYGIVAQKVGVSCHDVSTIRVAGFYAENSCFPIVYNYSIIMGQVMWHQLSGLWERGEQSPGCLPYNWMSWFITLLPFLVIFMIIVKGSSSVRNVKLLWTWNAGRRRTFLAKIWQL